MEGVGQCSCREKGACISLVVLATSPKVGKVYSVTIEVTAIYITVLLCHVFVLVSIEVLTQGTWNDLGELEDPELVGLAQRLQGTITCSQANSTVKKCLGAFRRWKVWASQHDMPSLPAGISDSSLPLIACREVIVKVCGGKSLQCDSLGPFNSWST